MRLYGDLLGARFSVNSIYVPQGSVRNATLTFVFGTWRMGASNLMPWASSFLVNASSSPW